MTRWGDVRPGKVLLANRRQPTFYDVLRDQILFEPWPHNLENFVCVADKGADDQVELDARAWEAKDGSKELVEVNLTTKCEEHRPIFMSANLLTELKQAILTILR